MGGDLTSQQAALLRDGIAQMGLSVSAAQQQQMVDYLTLLEKWNRTYNLTAIHDSQQMVTRHLLDSLTVVPYIKGQRIADVGTGAGLPGVVLAILFPQAKFVLLDSSGKKTRFITQAIMALGIDNVAVHNGRVEAYYAEASFDQVVSRAFAELKSMVELTRHLLCAGGEWIAMKGRYPAAELEGFDPRIECVAVDAVTVPGDQGERHIVRLRLAGAGTTENRTPRRRTG